MADKLKNFISAVVYVRNCEKVIAPFLKKLAGAFDERFEHSEIICVNDASTDGSADRIRQIAGEISCINVTILHLSSFHGREAAMQGGVELSIGDFVYEFDIPYEDLNEKDMMALYDKIMEGNDIVSAVTGSGRKTSSRLFYSIFNKFADINYPLDTDCFRLLSRRAINRIGSQNNVISYRKVAYATCGLNYASVTIDKGPYIRDSREGKKARRALAVDSLLMYTNVGFGFSLIMTVIMMAVMLFVAVYALIVRIMNLPIAGWTSTVLIIAFGFFGIFGMLTIITKYLQLLININVKKKQFTFENIEKIN